MRGLLACQARRQARGLCSAATRRHLQASACKDLCDLLFWRSANADISQAVTLPSPWYGNDPRVLDAEEQSVFRKNSWQWVGWRQQLKQPGDFFTGQLLSTRYMVCLDGQGQPRAFHNVCRHHAMAVTSGQGCQQQFQCPYHGWTYGLDGRLMKATRLKGIQDFKAAQYGLTPIKVDTWGPFLFLNWDSLGTETTATSQQVSRIEGLKPSPSTAEGSAQETGTLSGVAEWLDPGGAESLACGLNDPLVHVGQREYLLQCNWKVFCDNYLDGGYHVPFVHKDLNSELDFGGYQSTLYPRLSIQTVPVDGAKASARYKGHRDPAYIFIYPNLMINRYGPWMDTNVVLPLTPTTCKVRFDWWVDPSMAGDARFIRESIGNSDQVQQEDLWLCEGVQAGLSSAAYTSGRYAPTVEGPMFHFHQLLYTDVMAHLT